MEHHFKIEDAKQYGIEKAIILYNIRFWLEKNKANGTNIHKKDGKEYYWTFNSGRAFHELFPYMPESSIKRYLKELESDKQIVIGSFNKHKYDRTKWYTTNEYCISQNDESVGQNDRGISQNELTIPDNKQQIVNTNINITSEPEDSPKEQVLDLTKLPESTRGKNPILRVLSIYNDLFVDKYGFKPEISIGRFGKQLKTLMSSKTELQVSALLIVYFNWSGMTTGDPYEQAKYEKVSHNVWWFFSSVNAFEAHLRNVQGLEFDNPVKVWEYVRDSMMGLSTKR